MKTITITKNWSDPIDVERGNSIKVHFTNRDFEIALKNKDPKNGRHNDFDVSKYDGESPFKINYGQYTNELDGMPEPVILLKTLYDETFEVGIEEWFPGIE